MFSLESPLLRTFVMLFKNPGRLSREFISGRRKHYYRPLQYFIFVILVYFIVRGLLDYDPVDNMMKVQRQSPADFQDNTGVRAGHFLSRNVNYFLPIWAAILGAFDWLFFFKSPYNYAERTAHAFYAVSHNIFLGTLVIPLTFINPALDVIKYPLLLIWITYSFTSFHKRNYLWTIVKCLIMALLSFAVYAGMSYTIVVSLI